MSGNQDSIETDNAETFAGGRCDTVPHTQSMQCTRCGAEGVPTKLITPHFYGLYGSTGGVCAKCEAEINDDSQEQRIHRQEGELSRQEGTIVDLRAKIEELEGEIDGYQSTLCLREEHIGRLKGEVGQATQRTACRASMDDKDDLELTKWQAEAAKQKDDGHRLRAEIERLQATVSRLSNQKEELVGHNQGQKMRAERAEAECKAKDEVIAILKGEIDIALGAKCDAEDKVKQQDAMLASIWKQILDGATAKPEADHLGRALS